MKRSLAGVLFVSSLSVLFFLAPIAHAQVTGERVDSFHASIHINADATVDVDEYIDYDTGGIARHGIYRDIVAHASTGEKLSFSNIQVSGPFTTSWVNSDVMRIKIGDPNVTFVGPRSYRIHYRVNHAIAYGKDIGDTKGIDELYWNVTGNQWLIPIVTADASVNVDPVITPTQSACYFGPLGSTDRCAINNGTQFVTNKVLMPGSGMTIAIGFPHGQIHIPTQMEIIKTYMKEHGQVMILFLIPIIAFVLMYRRWSRVGRDPKDPGVIVPEYDTPDGLTPIEAAGLLRQRIAPTDISAEIVYLAVRGFITITQTEDRVLGIFKTTEYILTKIKENDGSLNDADAKLLGRMFDLGDGTQVKLSEMNQRFYRYIPSITGATFDTLTLKHYFTNPPFHTKSISGIGPVRMIRFVVWVTVFFGIMGTGIFSSAFGSANMLVPLMIILFTTAGIVGVFAYLMPARSELGVATKNKILGLKMYLTIAEKDRIAFHNAPEKKPEIFEKLLPYAMVLGVEKAWAKEFEGIYMTPPQWYVGPHASSFNIVNFVSSMSSFNTSMSTAVGSAPGGGGGSGGGGSSGGGGGGGGGGGW